MAMDYNIEDAESQAYPPETVGFQNINNQGGTVEQSTQFLVGEWVTETKSFSHTAGVGVKVGTEFTVGVPLFASTKVTTELSANYQFTTGKTESVQTRVEVRVLN